MSSRFRRNTGAFLFPLYHGDDRLTARIDQVCEQYIFRKSVSQVVYVNFSNSYLSKKNWLYARSSSKLERHYTVTTTDFIFKKFQIEKSTKMFHLAQKLLSLWFFESRLSNIPRPVSLRKGSSRTLPLKSVVFQKMVEVFGSWWSLR